AVAMPAPGHAASVQQQRALFHTLKAAAEQGALERGDPRLDALRGYPLYSYVIAARLEYAVEHNAGPSLDEHVAAFIDNHANLPPAEWLRGDWLKSLAERGRWSLLLRYTHSDDGTEARCRAVHARIELDQSPRSDALALWRTGRSQPAS